MYSISEEQKKFNRSLETGRAYRTYMLWDGYDHAVDVKARGYMSSPQFTMIARPSEYGSSWLDIDEPVERRPGMVQGGEFQADDPYYKDLEQQIMKEGIKRPVILGPKQGMMVPPTQSGRSRIVRVPAHPVMDGHHRAFYAIKHGLHIPVVEAVKYRG